MFPRPRHDRSQVLACFVRSATGIGAAVLGSLVMDPIQKIANMRPVDLVDIDAVAPGGPLGDGGLVFLPRPAGEFLGREVLY